MTKLLSCGVHPLAAIRASVFDGFRFPRLCVKEDAALTAWLAGRLDRKRVYHIDRVLYVQRYREHKPEFGGATYRRYRRGEAGA